MPTKREKIKDFLSEIDAVLHDNSIAAQAFQAKVLDMVFQPNQAYVHYILDEVQEDTLLDMECNPLPDDAEPNFLPEFDHWLGPNVHPDYSEDFPDDYIDPYVSPSKYVVVDGVLYVATSTNQRFASLKGELIEWETNPNPTGYSVPATETSLTDIPFVYCTVHCPLEEPLSPTFLTSRQWGAAELIVSFQNRPGLGS